MSREAQVVAALTIRKGALTLVTQPQAFNADVSPTAKGPTPGAFMVSEYGTDTDLSLLTTPGLCRLSNLDETYWVEYGIYDLDTGLYFPLGELLPEEFYVIRLSRNLGYETGPGTGTGTTGGGTFLRFRSFGGPAQVLVEAFDA